MEAYDLYQLLDDQPETIAFGFRPPRAVHQVVKVFCLPTKAALFIAEGKDGSPEFIKSLIRIRCEW
jgi:hypothetical protein